MQFIFAHLMFMHCHALLILFLFLEPFFLSTVFSVFLFSLDFGLWHPKSLFRPRTQLLVIVLLLLLLLLSLFLIKSSSVMRIPKRIPLRTFMTRQFIRNAKSFCLTFQTLLFPVHLAHGVGNLYMRNPWGVTVCSYMSSTPTCMPSIPLFLSWLWYSVKYVS